MQKAAILSVARNTTSGHSKRENAVLATRRQDGDAPDYYVPSNFVYPFNIANTVVRLLIN